jgi:hypothetical protein
MSKRKGTRVLKHEKCKRSRAIFFISPLSAAVVEPMHGAVEPTSALK